MRRPEDGHQIEPLYGAIGGPLYAVHYNGFPYAAFASPNQALMYWRGLSRGGASGSTSRTPRGGA
jgi:hypothetical protein